jgi:hypothetical protein
VRKATAAVSRPPAPAVGDNVAVKWVYQQVRGMDAGQKPSLCFRGRKWALCVIAAHPVRVVKRLADDFDKYRQVYNTSGIEKVPYSVRDAAQRLTEIAGRCGVTRGAKTLLDRALAGTASIDDEETFQDEEVLETDQTQAQVEKPKRVKESTESEATPAPAAPKNSAGLPAVQKKVQSPKLKHVKTKAVKSEKTKPVATGKVKPYKPGTIGAAIVEAINAGKSDTEASHAVAKAFPGTKFADEISADKYNSFRWYKRDAEIRGLLTNQK